MSTGHTLSGTRAPTRGPRGTGPLLTINSARRYLILVPPISRGNCVYETLLFVAFAAALLAGVFGRPNRRQETERLQAQRFDLPIRQFDRPTTGLVDVEINTTSGTPYTTRTVNEIFLAGTQPTTFDQIDEYNAERTQTVKGNLQNSLINSDLAGGSAGLTPVSVPTPDTSPAAAPDKSNPLLS